MTGSRWHIITLLVVAILLLSGMTGAFYMAIPSTSSKEGASPPPGSLNPSISPSSVILDDGQSITLTLTGGASNNYWWVTSSTGSSYVSTSETSFIFLTSTFPSSGSPYTVTVSSSTINDTGTNYETSTIVTVYPVPVASISPETAQINVGQSIQFTSSVSGGTGSFNYLWYLNNSATSVTTSTYSFQSTGAGTFSFYVYVTDTGTSPTAGTMSVRSNVAAVTVIVKQFTVIFDSSNLPSGIKWFVNLTNGQSFNSTSSIITFNEPNGTYLYTITAGNKVYSPSPAAGQINVAGNPVTVTISFSEVTYKITFSETGLNNTLWFVNQSQGPAHSSNNFTIIAFLPNGTYSFYVATVNKTYFPNPSSFTLRVNGQSSSEQIVFSLFTYAVSFSESGLPSGTKWFLNVSGPIQKSLSTTSSLISFNLPNGTYNYSISNLDSNFAPHSGSGNFTITGSPKSIGIIFLRLYNVEFYQEGLPAGIKWYVNITDPQSFNSSNTSLIFKEPNGSYHYFVGIGNTNFELNNTTSTGNFTVDGLAVTPAPQSSPIVFYALHIVTFQEHRLPPGIIWYLNITGGRTFSTFSNSISFKQPNGTYQYKVFSGNNLYRPSPSAGSFSVKGWPLSSSSLNLSITFYLVTYVVSFVESGLTTGTPWSVTLNNTTKQSINNTIIFTESNGSYPYFVDPLSGFSTYNYTGNVTVNGSALSETVVWNEVLYKLQIIQSGISQGTHWSATLEGRTFNGLNVNIILNSTGSSVVFDVPNGSYNYTISPPLGYSGSHMSGNVLIQGSSATASVFFQAPNYILIAMALALIMAGLAVALYIMVKRDNRSMFRRESRFTRKDGSFFSRKK